MSAELILIGNMLIVVEGDLDPASKKMIAALESGAISEARFAEWACLREATA